MKISTTLCLGIAALIMTGCEAVEASPQPDGSMPDEPSAETQTHDISQEEILSQYLYLNARTENIAYDILKSNLDSCPQKGPQIGISVHTILDYPDDIQPLARQSLGLGPLPQIRHVVSGSAAERAGLQAGDVIESIGEHKLVGGASARQFYDGVSQLEFGLGQTEFTIRRGESRQTINVIPDRLCGYDVELLFSDQVNAYTDGEGIWLTTELVSTTEKEISLALILAHELAHATEGHMFRRPSKGLEVEADFLGMQYLLNAGYDGELALTEWAANPFNHRERPEVSHPSPEDRVAAMQRAIDIWNIQTQ